MIQEDAGVAGGVQQQVFGRQVHAGHESFHGARPAKMRVRLGHSGHQCGAAAVDDLRAVACRRHAARTAHGGNAVPFTSTSPANGPAPLPSKMRTFVNRITAASSDLNSPAKSKTSR